MNIQDLIGRNVIRTQAIKIGGFMDMSYMHYPVHVERSNADGNIIISDYNNEYYAILGREWIDDNWEIAGKGMLQYKKPEYDKMHHIIKADESHESIQSLANRSKSIVTKKGDSLIFDKVKSTNEKSEAMKDHPHCNDADMLNELLGIDRSDRAKIVDICISKLDYMDIKPLRPTHDNTVELKFPDLDCEDITLALEILCLGFRPYANDIFIEITKPDSILKTILRLNTENGKITISNDRYKDFNKPHIIIYTEYSNEFYNNAMMLYTKGVICVTDLSAIMMADGVIGYELYDIMAAMAICGPNDHVVCVVEDKIYIVTVDSDNSKISFTKSNNSVVNILDKYTKKGSIALVILKHDQVESFNQFIKEMKS